ncbi:MAG: FliM/FliN family flagellar motor switch protein [Rhodobacteraceae bacterium]|nr:FliM/FliN family flagellar motor switch protein [Paracoccaceae bacterium]
MDEAVHPDPKPASSGHDSAFTSVPIEVRVSVGRARPSVAELLRLNPDSVLELDRRVEDPVELYVGDRLIARGQLEELDGEQAGQLAVRLTEVASDNGSF